jgi:DNA mismatch endonuclease (patch repair protein)
MRANRARNTRPELNVRRAIHAHGLRYRVNRHVLNGQSKVRPDIVFPARRIAVFIDGCFWHRCEQHRTVPRTNEAFWSAKLAANVQRDRRNDRDLASAGWLVLRFWEHEELDAVVGKIRATVAAVSRMRTDRV